MEPVSLRRLPSHLPGPIEKSASRAPTAWMILPWHCAGLFIGILYWAVFGSLLTLTGAVLHPLLPRETGARLGQRILHWLFRWFLSLTRFLGLVHADLSDLDALRGGKPVILAPNHAALWDAVFIVARLPQLACVMKPSILRNLFLGGGARLAGYIPGQPITQMIRAATDELAAGRHLLYFPEGTRTDPAARWINPLRGGCALIATRAAVPVQTIFIRSNSRFLQKGWTVFRRPAFPIHVAVECGPVLVPQENESPQDFTRRLEETYLTHLARPHALRRKIEEADARPS